MQKFMADEAFVSECVKLMVVTRDDTEDRSLGVQDKSAMGILIDRLHHLGYGRQVKGEDDSWTSANPF